MREKSQEKKNGILQATLELVSEQGFHGTSISQIAKQAKVNVGSIYYYFESKDDIITALYLDCKSRITERAFSNCPDSGEPDIRLKAMMQNIIRYFSKNRRELSFIVQFENSPYASSIALSTEYADIMKPYVSLFNELKESGRVKDIPVRILSNLMSGAVVSLAGYCIDHAEALEETSLTSSIEAIWDMAKK
ncbi:MAG: TetR/AcrR family transcriptional regulator [Oscillospiraceae bacterium]|jgi:AcrR family transcriptional regulator|nr:TetR/AcrR family transcriptional regulator [Oscillospiraceae bacterium]